MSFIIGIRKSFRTIRRVNCSKSFRSSSVKSGSLPKTFRTSRCRICSARADKFAIERDEQKFQRVTGALIKTFSAREFSLESALTCRAASNLLQEKLLEEASLGAILNSLDDLKLSDVRLLLSELPNLLTLPYPVVKDLRGVALEIISQTMDFMRQKEAWKDFSDLEHLRRLLKLF